MPKKPGIYAIRNRVNGKLYIGSAINLSNRTRLHRWALRKGSHDNSHLQAAWNKFGEAVFEFVILELREDILGLPEAERIKAIRAVEQEWLDQVKPFRREIGYNLDASTGRTSGTRSRESIEKATAKLRGRRLPPEVGQRISAAKKGKVVISEEQKKQISAALTGKKQSEETKSKRAASLRGGKRTLEQRQNISASKSGRPLSSEHRKALSMAHQGKASSAKTWVIIDPTGVRMTIYNLSAFCRENGLSKGCMRLVADGAQPVHRGWGCERVGRD